MIYKNMEFFNAAEAIPYDGGQMLVRYPESARKICPKCMDKRKIFFRLASFFKPHAFGIFIIFLMSILGALMGAILPYLSGSILYDEVLSSVKKSEILKHIPINDFSVLLLMLVLTMV